MTYICEVCGYVYDEEREGTLWADLPDDWSCPVCGSTKAVYKLKTELSMPEGASPTGNSVEDFFRESDEFERYMADIHAMAQTNESIIEPMRTKTPTISWDEILIKGAQLARIPLNESDPVNTQTVIGPCAARPLVIDAPVFVTHMSFGALSREAKVALARGSAGARTAMCSGEGGVVPESLESSYKYIFEYVPNRYSLTDEHLLRVDAIEIKIGQSAKPGMGGHLPGMKVTDEIAEVRGFSPGEDIISPAHHDDIRNPEELKKKIEWLRERSEGKPIGVKLAAGHIEEDLEVALYGGPDFITLDGRAGATGAAPKFVKGSTSTPSMFALSRARRFLDGKKAAHVSLVITGGLRISADFAKALALGADAVAIGTAALMAIGCQQYRMCHTGKCPMGITTHDPALRSRLDVDRAATQLAKFLSVSTHELMNFARLTGHDDVHLLDVTDLCTVNSEISKHMEIEHV
jgi:methylamine---glutamate N-methyltransferase subunit C